jgi:ubiquinone/menaquinone biosynthesis C-methylase UbiE
MDVLFSESERDKLRRSELAKYDATYFEGDYWKEDLSGVSGNRGLSYDDPSHEIRFGILASALADHAAPASVLDVGCGPGLLCKALAGRCERIEGVDASPAAIELAGRNLHLLKTGITVQEANAISLPFEHEQFDLVVCLDVLEHLPVFDIQSAVTEILRVSADRAVFSINTDNAYEFHPTILSPATWRGIFASQPGIMRDGDCERAMSCSVSSLRTEYDFYCYRRASPRNGQCPEQGRARPPWRARVVDGD